MVDPEAKRTSNVIEMTSIVSAAGEPSSPPPSFTPTLSPEHSLSPSPLPAATQPARLSETTDSGQECPVCVLDPQPRYFETSLHDAENMLTYAAETGIEIDEGVRRTVLEARAACRVQGALTQPMMSGLLVALTKLTARLKPVTAESLRACEKEEARTLRRYWLMVGLLAAWIIPFSIASFVSSAISQAVRADITLANGLAVKLTAQLDPPSATSSTPATGDGTGSSQTRPSVPIVDALNDLQMFAATIRAIDNRSRQLERFFPFSSERDPFAHERGNRDALRKTFQLSIGIDDLAHMTRDRIRVYQDVRYFAQCLLDDVNFWYGAFAACLLPVLYALLGTCAYLLQLFEDQMKTRTFTLSPANSARFLIAGIGGAVVGLFNNFTLTQSTTIPPLALAFLVGYAVDVFFSFLDGLVQVFKRTKTPSDSTLFAPSQAPPIPTAPAPATAGTKV
jgi:hypothetical protein